MKNIKRLLIRFGSLIFVLLPYMAISQGINIPSEGTITVTGSATIEISDGGLTNNGTYTKGTETVTFSGTYAKTITGNSTEVYNLVISNTGGITTQVSELTANNVTLNSSAVFTVDPGKAVTVKGNLSNSGTFTIQSDASSNGSLTVSGTSSGNITYNRYLTGVNKWHLISSPVSGQSINDFVVTNASNSIATNSTKYGLAPYNNSTPAWEHYTTSTIAGAGNFTLGKGYEVLRTADGTVSFTGTLSTSDVSISITKSASGWNLIGNPFPSSFKGNNPADGTNNFILINTAALDDSYEAMYVWDAASSSYITVNHTYSSGTAFYLAPGQSFFAYSIAGGATVNFTEAMQTHQTGNIFKSGTATPPTIKLIAERTEGKTSTQIIYLDKMTIGLDPGYDAGRFSGGDNSFAIYTRLVGDDNNNTDLDIQCLPAGEYNHSIPVGFNAPKNTEVVFKTEVTNLPDNVPVYLEDRLMSTYKALHISGSSYIIKLTEQMQGTGRFFLHTQSLGTGINPSSNKAEIYIIPRPQTNIIRVIGFFENDSRIIVYDLLGRKLLNQKLNSTEINDVEMRDMINGVYIIRISSSTQNTSKKISWVKN